jgi:hypothetical protein
MLEGDNGGRFVVPKQAQDGNPHPTQPCGTGKWCNMCGRHALTDRPSFNLIQLNQTVGKIFLGMPGSSADMLTATGAELAAKMASQRAIGSAWSLVQFRLTSSARPPYWLLCPSIGGDPVQPVIRGSMCRGRMQAYS